MVGHVLLPCAGAVLTLLVGAWLTHLWIRFTPVYQDIVCKLGDPKLSGIHLGVLGLTATTLNIEIAVVCTNPNFYHIALETAEKGEVTMSKSRIPVGWMMASPYSASALPAHGSGTIYTTAEVSISGTMITDLMPSMLGDQGVPVYMELNNKMQIEISFFFGMTSMSMWLRKKCGMEIASFGDLLNSKDQIGPVACADSWGELVVPRLTDTGSNEIVLSASSMSGQELPMASLAKNLGLGGAAVLFYLASVAFMVCACMRWAHPPSSGSRLLNQSEDSE